MLSAIKERLEIFRDIAERPWFRAFSFAWVAVGAWDLVLSQFVPEEYSRNFPKLYQMVGMTAGWLSLWAWLMVGALSLVAGSVEWAFRHKNRYLELLHQRPIPGGDQANFSGIVGDQPLIGNPSSNIKTAEKQERVFVPLELHEHFESDFVAYGKGGVALSCYSLVPLGNGKELTLEWRLMADFESHSRFLVYYIPESTVPSYEVAKRIAELYQSQLDAFETTVRTSADHAAKSSAALKFTGRIFVYHEGDMTDAQRTDLIALYKANGLEPEFRSRSYPLAVFDATQRVGSASSAMPRK